MAAVTRLHRGAGDGIRLYADIRKLSLSFIALISRDGSDSPKAALQGLLS